MSQLEHQPFTELNEANAADADLFEDVTEELFNFVDDKLEPMQLMKGDGFNWEEVLNASELLHAKMDTRLGRNYIWEQKQA